MPRSRSLRVGALIAPAALVFPGCTDDPVPAPPAQVRSICDAYAPSGGGRGARVFVVQPKMEPEGRVSYEAFRGSIERLVEEQVRPCLAADRPNLVVFPEDLGLPAAFVGTRAAEARSKDRAAGAFLSLRTPYAPTIAYYQERWPDLGLINGLVLGLTDTLWRAFFETMRDVARSTGAYVIGSTNVSGAIRESSDPADIEALRDPDLPVVERVYVAASRAVYNAAYVFAPSGEVTAVARKPYLVPLEESQLLLSDGPLREVRPIDVGFAKLGIVTSKDAWMPDMVDRLEALGANVLVQPEAFSGWGIEELPGDWLPAVVQQSGWAATQKHGGLRHALIPHLTGNLFDLVFDGQSAIVGDSVPGETTPAYVGVDPAGGFVRVAPWVVQDPGIADPSRSLEERRAALRSAAEALLPGGANDNGYVAAVIAADIDPTAPFPEVPAGPAGALGPSAAVAPSAMGEQTRPALAGGAPGVFVAWQESREGRPQIHLARSDDGGSSFVDARAVAPSAGDQITPAVLVVGGAVLVAWQERLNSSAQVLIVRSEDGGRSFGAPIAPGGAAAEVADEWGPALAADAGQVLAAFSAQIGDNERILVARAAAGTGAWAVTAADGAPPGAPGMDARNNQWAPAIAAQNGQVAVAWVDFRDRNWDVFSSRSPDGGQTFAAAARVDDGTMMPERIHDDASLLFLADGAVACAWTDVRLRATPSSARVARIVGGAALPSVVLGGAPRSASAWRPRLARMGGAGVAAVWQDFRSLGNDIYLAASVDGGATFGAERRVDDGGDGPSYQFAPTIAAVGEGKVVIAWEDTREGRRQIRAVAGDP